MEVSLPSCLVLCRGSAIRAPGRYTRASLAGAPGRPCAAVWVARVSESPLESMNPGKCRSTSRLRFISHDLSRCLPARGSGRARIWLSPEHEGSLLASFSAEREKGADPARQAGHLTLTLGKPRSSPLISLPPNSPATCPRTPPPH